MVRRKSMPAGAINLTAGGCWYEGNDGLAKVFGEKNCLSLGQKRVKEIKEEQDDDIIWDRRNAEKWEET